MLLREPELEKVFFFGKTTGMVSESTAINIAIASGKVWLFTRQNLSSRRLSSQEEVGRSGTFVIAMPELVSGETTRKRFRLGES